MRNLRILCVLTLYIYCGGMNAITAQELPEAFQVIPHPQEVTLQEGVGMPFAGLKAVHLTGKLKRPVMPPLLSALPESQEGGRGIVSLAIARDDDLPHSPEGYVLNIDSEAISIRARGAVGIFYGCQTLEQMLEDARDTGHSLPACRIRDFPALTYRAVHIDVKHHLDTMEYYYASIDRLARYKINAVIFEFEDKLRYRRRPEVGAPQAISIDEMAALTRYARRRHIEISPLVQGLGHATFILKHQENVPLREDPESNWAFCPCDEGTYEVLFDLYRDAMAAAPGSRYLHVGGDEIGEIGKCDRCRPRAEKEGLLALNLYWLNRVCDFARENGRIPIFWDDMLFKYAGVWNTMNREGEPTEVDRLWAEGEPILDSVLGKYPKDCVYMRWNYSMARQRGNIRALEWFRSRGLKAWIATAAQNVHPLFPQDDRVDIIWSFNRLAHEKGIDGMLCTAWDDSSPHMETYWRGLIASAEFSWAPEGRTREEYETAYLQREFGPECIDATDLYAELFAGVSFWNRALCAEGVRRNCKQVIALPESEQPGPWSRRHAERLKRAAEEVERYRRIKQQLADLSRKTRRNRYQLEMLTAINEFQITSARLLLALKESDTGEAQARDAGIEKVKAALSVFAKAWESLKFVYSRTRFLAYPPDYVKDRYFHMASKSEDLSWMISVESRLHTRIKEWITHFID